MSRSTALAALTARRSYYSLLRESPIPDSRIQSILSEVMHKTPSAFNSQSTRTVLLLKSEHDRLWSLTKDVLLERIGPERFQNSVAKLDSFKAAYGTVLFYEDQPTIAALKDKFALYKEHFEPWSEHTSGMHQLMTWVALEEEGFGANLQHYNPIIDDRVAGAFGIPTSWKLRAQLVFGLPDGARPAEKEKKPLQELMIVRGGGGVIHQHPVRL
ncbi:Nitroreductase-like protein [Aspergillus avenaceus]|uniref:Nitroreductase-like protein n=1 Tax=Aspergillus avenaceus TaxID=36643 RepID=A0A5N6U6N2_ASPAV|nr:Nitroreductase-like protein [Aspergillus avenaceus]